MSSPTKIQASPKGIREGTRVILREITATMNNSPPTKSPMSGNETFKKATPEHEVKVNFAREFADAESYPSAVCPTIAITPAESNSISTASSFQSLTSTLSTKSSSGICVDSPSRSNDDSYSNLNDTGLDDLISACARIHLEDTTTFNADQSFGDVTFASATDELQLDRTVNITRSGTPSPVPGNETQTIDTHANETKIITSNSPSPCDLNSTWNSNANILPADTNIVSNVDNNPALNTSAEQISPEYSTANDLHTHFSIKSPVNAINEPVDSSQYLEALESNLTNDSQVLTSPVSSDCLNDNSEFKEPVAVDKSTVSENVVTVSFEPLESEKYIETKFDFFVSSTPAVNETPFDTLNNLETINSLAIETAQEEVISEEPKKKSTEEFDKLPVLNNTKIIEFDCEAKTPNEFIEEAKNFEEKISLDVNKESNKCAGDLDSTLLVDGINFTLSHEDLQEALASEAEVKEDKNITTCTATEGLNLPNDYGDFTPQRQSTTLVTDVLKKNINTEESFKDIDIPDSKYFGVENDTPLGAPLDFEKLKLEAETIVKDIHNTTAELEKETFVPASPELFRDPSQVDFFLEKTGNGRGDRLRSDSLFANFDPLVSESSMLPQGNGASPPASNDEQNGEKETSLPNNITPKRNPAIAAIDRLLFYSPMTPDNIKNVESEKIEPVEKTVSPPVPVVDSAMAEELELVRANVLQLEKQLEEQLEKQKHSYEKQLDEKDKKNKSLQDTINQLQKQLAQEIKNKDQIAVIVDEHEKSISRLVAEREKNRNDIDAEKAFLLEELAETKKHLEASEASFNDVHSKYEKMKQAMVLSHNNEATLRESLENNIEVMKGLQNRYEQIKLHAAARLDKANQDLEVMRKQHESEIIKLRAMLKKEELKCNSLTEMIDQKTKENKELTKILDEVIARVNPSNQ